MSTWGDQGRRLFGCSLFRIPSASRLCQRSNPDAHPYPDQMQFNQCLLCTRICLSVLGSLIWPSDSTNWNFYHCEDPEYGSRRENIRLNLPVSPISEFLILISAPEVRADVSPFTKVSIPLICEPFVSHPTAEISHLQFVGCQQETDLPLNPPAPVVRTRTRGRSHRLCSGFKDCGYNAKKEQSQSSHVPQWCWPVLPPDNVPQWCCISPLILMSRSNERKLKSTCIARSTQSWPSVARDVAVGRGCGEQGWPRSPQGFIS